MNNHLPTSFQHWIRQSEAVRKLNEEKVYQVSQVPINDPTRRPEAIAVTSKASAQRLIAALAEQKDGAYRYAVTACFLHASLPGLERPGVPTWYPARIAERQAGMERS